MTTPSLALQQKSYARIAGVLYLVIAVFGAFSIGYVPSVIIEAGDAAATANNLLDNKTLFNMGIIGDIVVLLVEVALTAMLYVMFRHVSLTLSLIAAWSRIAMVMVMAFNLVLNVMPAFLLGGSEYLNAFETAELQSAALVFFDAHALGIYVWQLFFTVHLIALGILIIKSDMLPRVLGWMIVVGSFGYFVQALAHLTQTENSALSMVYIGLLVVVTIGELSVAFWLLIKGAKA